MIAYRVFLKVVVKTFHRVLSTECNIECFLVFRVDANRVHLFCGKVHNLVSDLKAKNQFVRESLRQLEAQTSIAAANIENLRDQISWLVDILLCVCDGVVLCVGHYLIVIVVWQVEEAWVVW